MKNIIKNVLVTGGAGYVGAVLIPKLLDNGYYVTVFDLYIYGKDIFGKYKNHNNLREVKGDIRDEKLMDKELKNINAIIHLACISNDPSFELNPELGKEINYDATIQLTDLAIKNKVKRFIYASSSSVYGVKKIENVTEDLILEPLTDYSKYKALCEEYILQKESEEFVPLIIRPATVCGYSKRQRLDLTVNILTNHGLNNKKIRVFGGEQKRPNIHIEDITDLYVKSLEYSDKKISGKIYNAGYENFKVKEIADFIKEAIGDKKVEIVTESSNDNRSYHISSEKIKKELGFVPSHSIADAVKDLLNAFENGDLPQSMTNSKYFNIKTMQEINLV